MSWVAIALMLVALFLAIKVAGALLKLVLWVVVLAGAYWLLAPALGLPWPI